MCENSQTVDVITARGSIKPGEWTIRELSPGEADRVELTLTWPGGSVRAASVDAFEALVEVRRELEAEGMRVVCWGACLHVYPSDASRGAGIGDEAYRLTLGRFPTTSDRVNIFEAGPGLVVATVEEQEEFSRAWFDSLADLPD